MTRGRPCREISPNFNLVQPVHDSTYIYGQLSLCTQCVHSDWIVHGCDWTTEQSLLLYFDGSLACMYVHVPNEMYIEQAWELKLGFMPFLPTGAQVHVHTCIRNVVLISQVSHPLYKSCWDTLRYNKLSVANGGRLAYFFSVMSQEVLLIALNTTVMVYLKMQQR